MDVSDDLALIAALSDEAIAGAIDEVHPLQTWARVWPKEGFFVEKMSFYPVLVEKFSRHYVAKTVFSGEVDFI